MSPAVTIVLGVVIGVVVAAIVFGLIFLFAVLPALRAKNSGKSNGKNKQEDIFTENATEEEKEEIAEEQAEAEEQEAVEILSEVIEEETAAAVAVEEIDEEPEETVEEIAVVEEKPEPVAEPEPVVEKVKTVKEEVIEEDDEEEEDDVEDNETEEEKEERKAAIESAPELEVGQRYNRSYKARLIQSSDTVKEWYSDLKNAALSYKGVKSSVSWRQEKLVQGKTQLAKIALRGKTLCVYYALNVKEIKNYEVEDVSDKTVHAATPSLFRIKNAQQAVQATELLAQAAGKLALEAGKTQKTNYVKEYALQTTEKLIEDGLVKIVSVKK